MDACAIFSVTPSDPIGPQLNVTGKKNIDAVNKLANGHYEIIVALVPRDGVHLAAFCTESAPGFGFEKPPQVYQMGLTNRVHINYQGPQIEDVTLTVGIDVVPYVGPL